MCLSGACGPRMAWGSTALPASETWSPSSWQHVQPRQAGTDGADCKHHVAEPGRAQRAHAAGAAACCPGGGDARGGRCQPGLRPQSWSQPPGAGCWDAWATARPGGDAMQRCSAGSLPLAASDSGHETRVRAWLTCWARRPCAGALPGASSLQSQRYRQQSSRSCRHALECSHNTQTPAAWHAWKQLACTWSRVLVFSVHMLCRLLVHLHSSQHSAPCRPALWRCRKRHASLNLTFSRSLGQQMQGVPCCGAA